jgi:hypothetical protein
MKRPSMRRAALVRRLLILTAGVVVSAVFSGCRTRTWVDTGPNPVPADFAVSLTVQRAPASPAHAGIAARGVRYQVEPDWVLRVGTGPRGARVDEQTPTAPAAQLTPDQMARLVERLRAEGLLNPEHPARAERNEATAPPAPPLGGTSYLLTWTSDGHRRTLAFADASQTPAGLAWLEGRLAEWSFVDRR